MPLQHKYFTLLLGRKLAFINMYASEGRLIRSLLLLYDLKYCFLLAIPANNKEQVEWSQTNVHGINRCQFTLDEHWMLLIKGVCYVILELVFEVRCSLLVSLGT